LHLYTCAKSPVYLSVHQKKPSLFPWFQAVN